jgi:beta propeller repeat protein
LIKVRTDLRSPPPESLTISRASVGVEKAGKIFPSGEMPKFIVYCIILTFNMNQYILVLLILGILVFSSGCVQPVPSQGSPPSNATISSNFTTAETTRTTTPTNIQYPATRKPLQNIPPGSYFTPAGTLILDKSLFLGNGTAVLYRNPGEVTNETSIKINGLIPCNFSFEKILEEQVNSLNIRDYAIRVDEPGSQYYGFCGRNIVSPGAYQFGLNKTPGNSPVNGIRLSYNMADYNQIDSYTIITRSISIVPVGVVNLTSPSVILENMKPEDILYSSNTTSGPLHLEKIELGYLPHDETFLCGGDTFYEPAWVLSGTNENGDIFRIWVWAADHEKILAALNLPRNPPDTFEIIIYDTKGGNVTLYPEDKDFPAFETEMNNILGMINGQCTCMLTQDELITLRNSTRSLEIHYPEQVTKPLNMQPSGLIDLNFNRAVFTNYPYGTDMVYINENQGCDVGGMYTTERNFSLLYGLADDYLANGHLTRIKNITPVPSLPQDPSFYPTIRPFEIETPSPLPVLKGIPLLISAGENGKYPRAPSIWEDRVVWIERDNPGLVNPVTINPAQFILYNITTGKSEIIAILKGDSFSFPSIFGDNVVYSDLRNGQYDIYRYDISTHTEQPLFDVPSKTGRSWPKIYGNNVVYRENGEIYVYNLETKFNKRVEGIVDTFGTYSYVDKKTIFTGFFSIDKNYVVFFGLDTQHQHPIILYNIETGILTKVINDAGNQNSYYPSLSGDQLVWENASCESGSDVYMYNLKTRITRNITQGKLGNFANGLEPVIFDNLIVYHGPFTQDSSIYVYDSLTGKQYLVPPAPEVSRYEYEQKIWGNRIVWSVQYQDSRSPIYLFTIDTSDVGE